MSFKVGMPNLGHTMDEGKLVAWLVAVAIFQIGARL